MENKTYLILLLFLTANLLFSQEKDCNCIDELENTSELIKNSKSYKIQIKTPNQEADFQKWKTKIQQEIEKDSLSEFFCSGYLQKYISFINDRHNQIYLEAGNLASSFPTYSKEFDEKDVADDDISGIYYAGSDEILLIKENDSLWVGITLKSKLEDWTKGKIRLRLNKTSDDKFEIFEFYANGSLFYQKNITIKDGRIHSTFWNKDNKYFFNKNHEDTFNYKSINPEYDYIGISTLKRNNKLIAEGKSFYNASLKNLNSENLIIDLRNNGGGAIKQAEPLLQYLKRNKSIKNIYVVINFKTASATELIALELKDDKRTIFVGENSSGMFAFGYGNKAFSTKTNCFGFKVVLSTEHTKKEFDKYEYIGITPDHLLDNSSDWIDQIIALSKKN